MRKGEVVPKLSFSLIGGIMLMLFGIAANNWGRHSEQAIYLELAGIILLALHEATNRIIAALSPPNTANQCRDIP
jgi:hypothetical protein